MFVVPVALTLGVGLSSQYRGEDSTAGRDRSSEPVLDASVGYRIAIATHDTPAAITFGLRAGWTRYGYSYEEFGNSIGMTVDTSADAYDGGLFVRGELGRFWIAPWIGLHDLEGTDRTTYYGACMTGCVVTKTTSSPSHMPTLTTGGALIGVDLWTYAPHRLSAFASIQVSSSARQSIGADETYTAFAMGLAYRL